MKNQILILVISIAPIISLSQVYFDNTYDVGIIDNPIAIVSDSLGNTYVCGWHEDSNFENPRAFAIKVNNAGEEIWRISLEELSKFHALCITENGNIALAGSRNGHCYLKFVSAELGNEIWHFEENTSSGYWFGSINEINNGNDVYLFAAKTINENHLLTVYTFDINTGSFITEFQDINEIQTPIFVSSKVSSDKIWSASREIVICNDFNGFCGLWLFNSLVIAGIDKYSNDRGCVVRLFQWAADEYYIGVLTKLIYGYEVYGNAFEVIHDNFDVVGSGVLGFDKILVTGAIEGELSLWIIDHELTQMEEKIYPNIYPRIGIDVIGLPASDMVIMGTEYIDNNNETDVFLMKLNSDGLVSKQELNTNEPIFLFPNPSSSEIVINYSGNNDVVVQIINLQGNVVKKIIDTNKTISIRNLPSGLYVAQIFENGIIIGQEKLIKY